ncbi:H+/Cl- antiporter ClcA [Paenibacillus eucommiae]|uniref:H+/Cl- antiporter ClcA n=1 Tax=Paenibacillus eucommiae TaxID=1355755 RepID=A0ABS4IVJ3_9BACL|nr:H+/Cl- antiporter ClcA [Paenibacillus eucommiae]
MINLISRKLISASISSCVFALIYSFFVPYNMGTPFQFKTLDGFIYAIIHAIPTYLLYAFPVIIIYGTITSLISEYIVYNIFKFTNLRESKILKMFFLGIFHLIFGSVLSYISLLAALLFFLIDQWLSHKREDYNWVSACISFLIPIFFYFTLMFFT